ALGGLADQALAVLGERDDRRRGARALGVLDDLGLAPFHHRDAAVGGAEVDTDYFSHRCSPHPFHWLDTAPWSPVRQDRWAARLRGGYRWPSAWHKISARLVCHIGKTGRRGTMKSGF